jgi:predicted Zn-dependent peptidase
MQKINVKRNADIFILPADKFKTFSVSFHFLTELSTDTVTKNAIFPFIMKLGSKNYPTMLAVNRKLQELYGGYFDCRVRKKGDMHPVDFSFEFLSPRYSEAAQAENCLNFMKEVLLNPLVENGSFDPRFLEREKENLRDYINGIINDKKEYTNVRLIEEMFKGENYALFEYGRVDDLKGFNGKALYEHYKKVIFGAPLIIFISGDIDIEKFQTGFADLLNAERNDVSRGGIYSKNLDKPVKVTENSDIVQGKFALGFQTGIKPDDETYYALTLFNGIFGSGPHSKLFMNVREKMSLCYYVYSRLDRFKGIMTVSIGTDSENFTKAYREILSQLDKCKNGEISENEIDFAKKYIISILKQAADNQSSLSEFYLTGILAGRTVSEAEYIEKIEKLTIEDVVKAAAGIKLQTEYYLS